MGYQRVNFKEQDNRADYYLDQIQRKQDRLDQASATIQKYNQALLQAQTGSDDLATLQLTRVVEANRDCKSASSIGSFAY